MIRPVLAGAIAGLVTAIVWMVVASGSPGGLLLGLIAPLPLYGVGLAFGLAGVSWAVVVGAGVLGVMAGPISSVVFAVLFGGPAVLLVRQALLSRTEGHGVVEWYPPGLLTSWLWIYWAAVFALGLLMVTDGGTRDAAELLRGTFQQATQALSGSGGVDLGSATEIKAALDIMARLPGLMVISWMIITAVNAILAQGLVVRFGWARRPTPEMAEIVLPNWFPISTAILVLAAFLAGGWIGYVAKSLLVLQGFAYGMQGLGVLHALIAKFRFRQFALIAFYVLAVLIYWPFMLVAAIGLVDQWAHFRRRFGGTR